MKKSILNLEEIKSEYSFYIENQNEDKYFCNCGEDFLISNEEGVLELEDTFDDNNVENNFDDEMIDIYKDIKLSLDKKIECPNCKKNFNKPDIKMKLIPIGKHFISTYEFEETKDDIFIYYVKLKPTTNNDYHILLEESIKFIRFNKNKKTLTFKDFGDNSKEIEFDLDATIKYVNMFFDLDTNKILNFYKLHMYINRLANFVSDTNNSGIVSEFLEFIRSKPNDVGITYIRKLLSIFYGIIKYSNLSTIALTKSSQFLYDLMVECDIPSSKEMKESGATSPVKIFNFLVTKYINKINKEVKIEDKESQDFVFKSKKRIEFELNNNSTNEEEVETKFLIRKNNDYKEGKVSKFDGRFRVLDSIEDGTISKFIYNHITNFSQYKQIIKYFKFYDKKEVISMLQKYNIDLITKAIDIIYFRDKMENGELDRVLQIIDSFVEGRFLFKDYNNVREFSFVEYDDTKMMMEILEFDPKRHFNKIKTYDDLVSYHDKLVNLYNAKTEEEKTGNIKNFVHKFKFLETKWEDNYNGPLEVELHDSPGRIIKEGMEMRHSVGEYAWKVAKGQYLIGSVYDRDPNKPEDEIERFTIAFKYNKRDGLEFDQVKGFANKLGSNRFKKLVMEYLTEKDVSYRPIQDLKLKAEDIEGDGL